MFKKFYYNVSSVNCIRKTLIGSQIKFRISVDKNCTSHIKIYQHAIVRVWEREKIPVMN